MPIAHGRSAALLDTRERFLRRDGEARNVCSSSSAAGRSDRGEISMACAFHGDGLPALHHHRRRALPHQGTRRTDTKHQECCATITQILPPAPPQPHKRAHSAPTSSVNHAGADHSPGKYSPAIPSSCARISSKGRSRSSVVALMRLPLMWYVASGWMSSSVAA